MRYEVPQFIEIEDKIIGPLTWRQFVYVAGAGFGSLGLWILLPSFIAILIIIPLCVLAAALAFYKHNKRPFIIFLESWFNYMISSKLYIWKKRHKPAKEPDIVDEVEAMVNPQPYVPKMSDSKLKDLSWALDIDEYNGEVL